MEEWRPLFEGVYAVSSEGRVRRNLPDRFGRGGNGSVVSPTLAGNGYPSFMPSSNGKQPRRVYVHAVVAEAFLGPRPPKATVNHIDGDKQNNRATNLEYLSSRDNVKHARDLGIRIGRTKLTPAQVREIRVRRVSTPVRELARHYNVHTSTIWNLLSRRTWADRSL